MRNGKTLLVLLRTAIFTAIVPYTVGLWLPTQAHRVFSEAPFRVEPERWQIILSLLLLLAGAAIYLWCAWDFMKNRTCAKFSASNIWSIAGAYPAGFPGFAPLNDNHSLASLN